MNDTRDPTDDDYITDDNAVFTMSELREAFKNMAGALNDGDMSSDDFIYVMRLIASGIMWFDGVRDGDIIFSGSVPTMVAYGNKPPDDVEPS